MRRLEDRIRTDLHHGAARFEPSPDLDARIDEAVGRREHRTRLAVIASATLTVAVVLCISALLAIPVGDAPVRAYIAAGPPPTEATAPAATAAVEVAPSIAVAPPPAAFPPPRRAAREGRDAPQDRDARASASASAPNISAEPSTVPAAPVLTVARPVGAVCTASWTAADGGSPIEQYVVTTESPPPPAATTADAPEADVATAMQATVTSENEVAVPVEHSVRVSAQNAVGAGPATDPLVCGG